METASEDETSDKDEIDIYRLIEKTAEILTKNLRENLSKLMSGIEENIREKN